MMMLREGGGAKILCLYVWGGGALKNRRSQVRGRKSVYRTKGLIT